MLIEEKAAQMIRADYDNFNDYAFALVDQVRLFEFCRYETVDGQSYYGVTGYKQKNEEEAVCFVDAYDFDGTVFDENFDLYLNELYDDREEAFSRYFELQRETLKNAP